MSYNFQLALRLAIEPAGNQLNLERLNRSHATYGDLLDPFSRAN